MIAEIETGIINYLREKWPVHGSDKSINEFDINRDFDDIINTPAVSVATEKVGVRSVDDETLEIKPVISLYIALKNVSKPDQRSHSILPIVVAVLRMLHKQNVELVDIEGLQPVGCSEVFHENLKKKGLAGWKLTFTTLFEVETIDDADAIRLLSEGLSYYVGEEFATEHATDSIDYE